MVIIYCGNNDVMEAVVAFVAIRYDVVSSDDDVRCVDMVMGER